MKQLLLSFSILVLSYYPVHATPISFEKSEEIVVKGEIIATRIIRNGRAETWVRYKGTLYYCFLRADTTILNASCSNSKPTNPD